MLAGCECHLDAHAKVGSSVQVFDARVKQGSAQCVLRISSSSEVLITAVYMVGRGVEDSTTTLEHEQ